MYEKYSNLLLSVANNDDIQFTSSGSQSSRKAYATYSNNNNLSCNSISYFTEEKVDYDIDASTRTLLINMANQNKNS